MRIISTLLLFCILLQSCATIFTGTKDVVRMETNPDGAKVLMNNIDQCKTPCDMTVDRALGSKIITIEKAGFETKTIQLNSTFNPIAILDVFTIVGLIVDVATGSVRKFEPKKYSLELEPKN